MTGRHESRSLGVQMLFQRDFNEGPLEEAFELFWEQNKTGPKVRVFTEELVRGVESHRPEIDSMLQSYAEHWDVARMNAIDRNIMRLALYEMFFRPDIPPIVSINEAVDLAKEYCGHESSRFVNGILDRAKKDLKRPLRCAAPDPRLLTSPPTEGTNG
jgi:N utilization substance protein B